MATGRIRRTARRGVAAAVLGWLSVAALAVVLATPAGAAPSATIEIRNLTPPVASVDPGGTVTFVNKIPAENRGGIDLGILSVSATIYTDVTVSFFGEQRALQPEQSTSWKFSAPATAGTITYTYRVVPQANLPLGITVNDVVNRTLASLPPLPAPIPYVVQTIAPAVPNLPSIGLPPLPQVTVPLPPLSGALPAPPQTPGAPLPQTGSAPRRRPRCRSRWSRRAPRTPMDWVAPVSSTRATAAPRRPSTPSASSHPVPTAPGPPRPGAPAPVVVACRAPTTARRCRCSASWPG
ncbi:hypothetical protein [Blastococcus sp. CCUG 61487]|uniref:hypothetical protein n=1 Tax=Blastococcus sp. CCUG 61487 TaxID=1840703 RepID=UPI0010C10CB0|nr:hypothetical protein [Blastococcus sp. CCUG 61487]TKJ26481.1 hypothetical protein A6V29_03865 [Blastococcus sp. CCUG 61487]